MTQHDLDQPAVEAASPTQPSAGCTCCVDDADMDGGLYEQDTADTGHRPHEPPLRLDGRVECWPACAACCHRFEHRFCALGCDAHITAGPSAAAALRRDTQQTSSASTLVECEPAHACDHQHDGIRHRPVYRLPAAESAAAAAEATTPAASSSAADDGSRSVIRGLSVVDRFLSVWIVLVMVVGVLVGYYSPSAVAALNSVQIVTVSLPVSIGLWLMMFPVLVKVKWESFGSILRRRDTHRQLLFSLSANWVSRLRHGTAALAPAVVRPATDYECCLCWAAHRACADAGHRMDDAARPAPLPQRRDPRRPGPPASRWC